MAGLIPEPFIDDVLARTDLVELIDSYVPLKKRGTSYVACCPFHNEKTPSFNVNASKQFYHCFGCKESGNAISFAMRYLQLEFIPAIELLAQRLGLSIPRESGGEKLQYKKQLTPLLEQVTLYYQQALKNSPEAIGYLQSRHLSGEAARDFQLGYAKEGWHDLETQFSHDINALIETGMLIQNEAGKRYSRYRHRVMFPIHNRQGQIIGFGGRAITPDTEPKYLNSPETPLFQKSRELYGLYQVIKQKEPIKQLIIVEGYMDVIALFQHGVKCAVATMGTATTPFHLQVLDKYSQNIVFCFDGDEAGRKAAQKALDTSLPYLNSGLQVQFMFLPEGEDPDSFIRKEGRDAFLARMQKAMSLEQFLLNELTANRPLRTVADKNQLLQRALPYMQQMGAGPYLELFARELSRLTHLEADKIIQHVKAPVEAMPISHQLITRTPTRIAIALLIQHPELYQSIAAKWPAEAFENLNPIIAKLMRLLQDHPNANTARLLEYFRDSKVYAALAQMASWEHQVPEAALVTEFEDTLGFILKQNTTQQIQDLLAKSRQQGLDDTEKERLQALLREKIND